MLDTRKILLKHPGKLLLLHWCNPQDRGWNQTEVLRDGAAPCYHATIYHGHLITTKNYHADI
jgi:hypothetical protein